MLSETTRAAMSLPTSARAVLLALDTEPRNADGSVTVDLDEWLPRVQSHREEPGISIRTFKVAMATLVRLGWVVREGAEHAERTAVRGRTPYSSVRHYRVMPEPGKAAA